MAKFTFERCFERFQAFIMLLFLLAGVSAFQLRTNQLRPSQIEADTDNPDFDARDALDILPKFTDSSTAVVSDGVDTVDLDKARDFASNYGKYSYEEVEHMRNDLHADLVKNASPDEVLFLERYLEDELTSQLQSLKDEMPNPYLFRYSGEDVPKGLFRSETEATKSTSTTSTTVAKKNTAAEDDKEIDTKTLGFEFSALLLEEGVLETLAICIIAGVLLMVPQ